MASVSAYVQDALAQINQLPITNRQLPLEALIVRIVADIPASPEQCTANFCAVANTVIPALDFPISSSRSVFSALNAALSQPSTTPETCITVGQHMLDLLPDENVAIAQLENICILRVLMAEAFESQGEFCLAAKCLVEVPVDNPARELPLIEVAKVWVRIARNYLQDDNPHLADTYIGKLMHIMHNIDDPEINLHYTLSAARVQDATHRFLDAAMKYHKVSECPLVTDEERLHTLSMAVKCGILAPAGPERTSLLGSLYRDGRSPQLREYAFLEKVLLQRFIDRSESDALAETLQPHQLALTADGTTVLARAVIEHNILAASKLYANISIDSLAELLHLSPERAERTAARMIEQQRLVGCIDQLEGYVMFEKEEAVRGMEAEGEETGTSHKDKGRATVRGQKLVRQWDVNIEGVGRDVEWIRQKLESEFPEWVAATLET